MVGPEAVGERAELEHHELARLDTARPRPEVLPSVLEVRPRVDRGVAAHDARAPVAVALDLDRGLDRGRDLHLGPARTGFLLEREHPEAGDLVRDLQLLELTTPS